jgi:hypothetical protein
MYRNGVLQKAGQDFTLAGNRISFLGIGPQPGDTLVASYRLSGVSDTMSQMYPNPQVLCSGLGASTTSATLASIGTCNIPAGFLAPGDRVEIRFDLEHQGAAGGFTFDVRWGATTVLSRNGSAADTLVAGRADAALSAQGAQLSQQSWGSSLSFAAGVASGADDYNAGVAIDFRALAASGDTVILKNFTVTRFP